MVIIIFRYCDDTILLVFSILRHKRGIRVISGDNPLIFRSPFRTKPFQVAQKPCHQPPCQRPSKPASCWSSCRCCATCRAWDVSDLESRSFLKPVHLSLKDEDEDVDVCVNQLQSPHGQGSSAPRPGVQHFVASMHSLFLPLHALPPAKSTRIPKRYKRWENCFGIHSLDMSGWALELHPHQTTTGTTGTTGTVPLPFLLQTSSSGTSTTQEVTKSRVLPCELPGQYQL